MMSEIFMRPNGFTVRVMELENEVEHLRAELATANDWRVVAEAGQQEIERLNAELAKLRASYKLACSVIDEHSE